MSPSAAERLALSVLALAPAGTVLGEIIGEDAPLPWQSLSVSIPGLPERSDAHTAQSYTCQASVNVASASDQGTLRVAGHVVDALEGARPVAAGWSCGPIGVHGAPSQPYIAEATVAAANRRLVVIHIAFRFTAVRLPTTEEP